MWWPEHRPAGHQPGKRSPYGEHRAFSTPLPFPFSSCHMTIACLCEAALLLHSLNLCFLSPFPFPFAYGSEAATLMHLIFNIEFECILVKHLVLLLWLYFHFCIEIDILFSHACFTRGQVHKHSPVPFSAAAYSIVSVPCSASLRTQAGYALSWLHFPHCSQWRINILHHIFTWNHGRLPSAFVPRWN